LCVVESIQVPPDLFGIERQNDHAVLECATNMLATYLVWNWCFPGKPPSNVFWRRHRCSWCRAKSLVNYSRTSLARDRLKTRHPVPCALRAPARLQAGKEDLGDSVDILARQGRVVRQSNQPVRHRLGHRASAPISETPAFLDHIAVKPRGVDK